jgi:hypothetical protein
MAVRDKIDGREYCDTVYGELSEMKRKIFDIVCKVESTTAVEEARKAEYFDLFDIVDYIEKKLALLTKECPGDWRETRREIESGRTKLDDAINWWYG